MFILWVCRWVFGVGLGVYNNGGCLDFGWCFKRCSISGLVCLEMIRVFVVIMRFDCWVVFIWSGLSGFVDWLWWDLKDIVFWGFWMSVWEEIFLVKVCGFDGVLIVDRWGWEWFWVLERLERWILNELLRWR